MKFITIRIRLYIFCDWFIVITIKFRHEVLHFLICDIPWASKSHHQRYFKSTARDGWGTIVCWQNRAIYASSFFNVKVGVPWNLRWCMTDCLQFPETMAFIAQQYGSIFLESSFVSNCTEIYWPTLTFSQVVFLLCESHAKQPSFDN